MAHPFAKHREDATSRARVSHLLKGTPGGTKHVDKGAYSRLTSKSGAVRHDQKVEGKKAPSRFARGGAVKQDGGAVKAKVTRKTEPETKVTRPDIKDVMTPVTGGLSQAIPTSQQMKSDRIPFKHGGAAKKQDGGAVDARSYARGGRAKKAGNTTNIAIVAPKSSPSPVGPQAGAAPVPPPMAAPAPPPPVGPAPPMMRARGGRLPHAGSESGVGRVQKAKR